MIRVLIDGVEYKLMATFGECRYTIIDSDKGGGFVRAEVSAVHTHDCVARRWGRRNRHKECNCGAQALYEKLTNA
jgi:hypothetical protein